MCGSDLIDITDNQKDVYVFCMNSRTLNIFNDDNLLYHTKFNHGKYCNNFSNHVFKSLKFLPPILQDLFLQIEIILRSELERQPQTG